MKKRSTTDYRQRIKPEVKHSASKFSLDMVLQYANAVKTIQINSKSEQIFLN